MVKKLLEAKAHVDVQACDGPGPLRLTSWDPSGFRFVTGSFSTFSKTCLCGMGCPNSYNLGNCVIFVAYYPTEARLRPIAFLWAAANQISLQRSYSLLMLFTESFPHVFRAKRWNLNTLRLIKVLNLLALQLVTCQGAGYIDHTMLIHFASCAL